MSDKKTALIDTNVLVYATDTGAPYHEAAKKFYDAGVDNQIAVCVTPQILLEYFSVVTNPRRVREASTALEAWEDVETFLVNFPLVQPSPDHMHRLLALGRTLLDVTGADLFDLAIATTMLSAGIDTIYTYDPKVFSKVQGITAVEPQA